MRYYDELGFVWIIFAVVDLSLATLPSWALAKTHVLSTQFANICECQSRARLPGRPWAHTPRRRIVATHPNAPAETNSRMQAAMPAARDAGCISRMKGEIGGAWSSRARYFFEKNPTKKATSSFRNTGLAKFYAAALSRAGPDGDRQQTMSRYSALPYAAQRPRAPWPAARPAGCATPRREGCDDAHRRQPRAPGPELGPARRLSASQHDREARHLGEMPWWRRHEGERRGRLLARRDAGPGRGLARRRVGSRRHQVRGALADACAEAARLRSAASDSRPAPAW